MTTINGSEASNPLQPSYTNSISDRDRVAITLHDLVSHVMDVYDLQNTEMDVRRARRSSIWGFEQAMTRHQWGIYDEQFTAYFNQQDKSGSITIDSSGVVTRSSPAWPTWSEDSSLYIGDDYSYRVIERVSDTQLKLDNWSGLSQSSTSDFSLRQDRIVIPRDVREVYDVWQEKEDKSIPMTDPRTFRDYDRPRVYRGSEPSLVTFKHRYVSGKNYTEMQISPAATTAVELDVAYRRRPPVPRLMEEVTFSSSGSTVTLSSPLPAGVSAVGAVLRVSSTGDNTPDSENGYGVIAEYPVTFEGIITSQSSQTVLGCSGVPTLTGKKGILTDTLDVPEWLMIPIKTYAEAQMSRIGRGDIREYRTMMAEADDALRYAMEQDSPFVRRSGLPALQVDSLERTNYVNEG
jgi:hypothetical protein